MNTRIPVGGKHSRSYFRNRLGGGNTLAADSRTLRLPPHVRSLSVCMCLCLIYCSLSCVSVQCMFFFNTLLLVHACVFAHLFISCMSAFQVAGILHAWCRYAYRIMWTNSRCFFTRNQEQSHVCRHEFDNLRAPHVPRLVMARHFRLLCVCIAPVLYVRSYVCIGTYMHVHAYMNR
jgi:hypothetical protein